MNIEDAVIDSVRQASVLQIIDDYLDDFKEITGSKPEVIEVHSSLRVSVITELIRGDAKMVPIDAVIEPFWLDGVPVIFVVALPHYIRLTNKQTRSILTI
jgi:hypothetical protein